MPPIEFLAERREGGQTIAAVLRKRFDLPWSQVKRLIERGHVRVAGQTTTDPSQRVRYKNRVWVREGVVEQRKGGEEEKRRGGAKPVSREAKPSAKPTPTPKRPDPAKAEPVPSSPLLPVSSSAIVYADDAVIVVDKPAGLTTMRHAEEADEFGPRGKRFLPRTLADVLPQLLGEPAARVVPVHRIDRDTSGLVVFARTPAAAAHLTRQFRKHTVDRRYLALVRGAPADGRIESLFVRDRGDGRRGSAAGPDGKRAVTRVRVLERFNGFALVECRLETGRTHQVRIHLGESGSPLCGERMYDRPVNGPPAADGSGARRPMLHAAQLGFEHPETGEMVQWEAPPPADFAAILARLRG